MNKQKAKKFLDNLDPLPSQLEEAMKLASAQLKETISSRTAEQANQRFKKLEKIFKDFLPVFEEYKKGVADRDQALLTKLQNSLKDLQDQLEGNRVSGMQEYNAITAEIDGLRQAILEVSTRKPPEIPDFASQIKQAETELLDIIAKENADRAGDVQENQKIFDEQRKKLEATVKDFESRLDRLRMDILSRIQTGGGNANRNIAVGGNPSVLSRYTDINIKPGSNVTLTYQNNDTTKYLDLTIAATGGAGTSRSISTVAVSSVVADTAATDIVVLASAGIALTMPTAVGNTNLYTIKNVSTSSVLIATTGGQTIDGQTTIIMPVQYTSVDLISDSANWDIT